MTDSENYFIKPGYKSNQSALTFEADDAARYWTEERLRTSGVFQHYVYLYASRLAKKKEYKSLIDIGSGPAIKTKKMFNSIVEKVVLVDQPSCESLARRIYPEAQFVAVNLEICSVDLPFMADLIICADVLEHLYDPIPCLRLALGHLSPTGIAVFSTPERDILRGVDCMTSPHPSHVREWNQLEFRNLLENSGFKVLEQSLLPAAKMSSFEEFMWMSSIGIFGPKHWKSCQLAVCRNSG